MCAGKGSVEEEAGEAGKEDEENRGIQNLEFRFLHFMDGKQKDGEEDEKVTDAVGGGGESGGHELERGGGNEAYHAQAKCVEYDGNVRVVQSMEQPSAYGDYQRHGNDDDGQRCQRGSSDGHPVGIAGIGHGCVAGIGGGVDADRAGGHLADGYNVSEFLQA